MNLGVDASRDEMCRTALARVVLALAQSAAKQLIPQPNSIDLTLKEISLDMAAVDALGLPWHAHDLAEGHGDVIWTTPMINLR